MTTVRGLRTFKEGHRDILFRARIHFASGTGTFRVRYAYIFLGHAYILLIQGWASCFKLILFRGLVFLRRQVLGVAVSVKGVDRFMGIKTLLLAVTKYSSPGSKKGSTRVSHFVDSLVKEVALRRGLKRLGLPTKGSLISKTIGGDGVTRTVQTKRINNFFGIGKISGVCRVRHVTIRRAHLKVPLVINTSIVRKCRAVFPVPLTLSYD